MFCSLLAQSREPILHSIIRSVFLQKADRLDIYFKYISHYYETV